VSAPRDLRSHADASARAITLRTGQATTQSIKGDQLLVRTTGERDRVRYRFIPSSGLYDTPWHYASIDFELPHEVAPTELRLLSWVLHTGAEGRWRKLEVLEAELGLKSATVDRNLLQIELRRRRVGLNELRTAAASGRVLHVSFLSPRPRSPSVIFERAAQLRDALNVCWDAEGRVDASAPPNSGAYDIVNAPRIDVDVLQTITAPFSGDIEEGGGRTWARVSLAGHVDERYTGVVEVAPDRVEGRFQIPPSPGRLSLAPQEGVLGWMRSFTEDHLGHDALDSAFIVDVEGEALTAFASDQAPPLLRLRDLGLHLEISEGWLMVTDLDVPADKHAPVITDLLELWRQLSLELVGLSMG
jgi:hypothetical protein